MSTIDADAPSFGQMLTLVILIPLFAVVPIAVHLGFASHFGLRSPGGGLILIALLVSCLGIFMGLYNSAFPHLPATFGRRVRSMIFDALSWVGIAVAGWIVSSLGIVSVFVREADASWSYAVGLGLAYGAVMLMENIHIRRAGNSRTTLRGPALVSQDGVEAALAKIPNPSNERIRWAGQEMPERISEGHFCIVGATGTGKTTLIRQLLQSIVPTITGGSDRRAMLYDAKGDLVPIIARMLPSCEVVLLNPFDARSAAWDIAADVTTPARATAVASVFVPDLQEYQPFFTQGARILMAAVMQAMHASAPGRWTLADVLIAMKSHERLHRVLWPHPHLRDTFQTFAQPEDTYRNILATVLTKIMPFEITAAAWSRAERRVSLEQWAKGEQILILGSERAAAPTIEAINRAIVAVASQILLSAAEPSAQRRTWLVFDELSKAGRLDGLDKMLTEGRSRGIRCVIGFQDIEGMRSPRAFGPETANEIVGQCANKAIFRLGDEKTATWASEIIGQSEVIVTSWSVSSSGSGSSTSYTYTPTNRQLVLPSEIRNLPMADVEGIEGYFVTLGVGTHRTKIRFNHTWPIDETTPAFVPRGVSDQQLSPWIEEDLRRLGLTDDASDRDDDGDGGLGDIRRPPTRPIR